MSRFFIGWELGGGLGHAGRLKPIAEGLQARGHVASLWLRDLVQTHGVLKDLAVPRLQAPVWMHRTMGLTERPATLAEILLSTGYVFPDHLESLVLGWLQSMRLTAAEVVVLDYAPTAYIAARIAGLPTACLGTGFWLPPDRSPLPVFRDWEPVPAARLQAAEARVLENINTVLRRHGAQPFDRLAQVFLGDLPLLCSWPEVDHYQRTPEEVASLEWLGPNFLPPDGIAPTWPAGSGPRVFAYLRASDPKSAPTLQALLDAGCRICCYMPEVANGKPAPVHGQGLVYAPKPVHLDLAFAESDLVACHAGQGTAAQALLAGLPLLLLPSQAEQFLMARQVERSGLGVHVGDSGDAAALRAAVRGLLQPAAPQRAAAHAFAERHRGFSNAAQVQDLLQRLESLAARGS